MKTSTLDSPSPVISAGASWRSYFYLTKPTITLLVVITALPSMLLATDPLPSISLMLWALLGTGLISASAAVFNQVFEKDVDAQMERTYRRSIPSGTVSFVQASLFGLTIGLSGFIILYTMTFPLAAWIGLIAHLFYSVFYTKILKPLTPQNIVIGGMAGAVGPLMGWAAVTGHLSWEAWMLFLIITLWTPPHFWSLALKYKDDFAKASLPMYPVVYGVEKTKKAMVAYSLPLAPAVASLFFFGHAGWIFLVIGGAFTVKFIVDAFEVLYATDDTPVMPFFHFSCTYTFVVFGALALDRLIFLSFA